ncbi:hypothetical protein BCR44DRAFT_47241 [Catenaria anguillulae PL171]|uniref:Uncharacterized protein n=1 Tax=Catenaria anguillulae PL171 TaxID=765915 RepID=A0A1Y2HQJ5_9FUNG|nr:hypothetical protein BCR44DRAFT_47241 [Catenaria anguillulae PL171]
MPPASPSSSTTATTTTIEAAAPTSAKVPFTETDRKALAAAIHANNRLRSPRPMTDVCRDLARVRPSHSYNSWYNFWNKTLRHQLQQGKAYANEFPRSAAAVAVAQWLKTPSPQRSSSAAVAAATAGAARASARRSSTSHSHHNDDDDDDDDVDRDDQGNGDDDGQDHEPPASRISAARRSSSTESVGVQTPTTSSAAILSIRRLSTSNSSTTPSSSSIRRSAGSAPSTRTSLTTPFSPPRPSVAQYSFTPPPRGSAPAAPSLPRRVSFAALPKRSPSLSPESRAQASSDRQPPHTHSDPARIDYEAATQIIAPVGWDPDASFAPINERSPAPLTTLRRNVRPDQRLHPSSSPRKRARHVYNGEDADPDEDREMQPRVNVKRSKPSLLSAKAAAGGLRNARATAAAYQGPVVGKAIRSAGVLSPRQPWAARDDIEVEERAEYQLDDDDTQPLPSNYPMQPVRHSATGSSLIHASELDRHLSTTATGSNEYEHDSDSEHPADAEAEADTVPYQPLRASGISRAPPSAPPPSTTSTRRRAPPPRLVSSAAHAAFPTPPTPSASSSSTTTSPHAHAGPRAPSKASQAPAGSAAGPHPAANLPHIDWAADPSSTHLDIQTWVLCLARDIKLPYNQVLHMLHSVNFNRKRCALVALNRTTNNQFLEWVWRPEDDNLLLTKPEERYPGDPKAQAKVWDQKRALAVLKGGDKALWERVMVLMGGRKVAKEGLVVEKAAAGMKGKTKAE